MPDPKQLHEDHHKPHPPKPHHDVPPHIVKELLDLREKIGRLEGMMEVLLKQQK